jgi:hypothetical protein
MRNLLVSFSLGLGVALGLATASTAQMPAYTEPGPLPPALASAKTIFVSNAGADSGLFPEPFSGDPDRAYTEFYAALKATGDYTLAGDPSQADLVLELRLLAPEGPSEPSKQKGASDPLPSFRLVVYDAKTHYILWTVTNSIDLAFLQKTHDKNFDVALAGVLNQFLHVSGKPPVPAH